jgi:hypothetical protein
MPNYLAIVFSFLGFFGYVFLFIIERIDFNKTGAKKYSFLRFFPFELNRFKRYQKSSYIYAIANVACGLFLTLPYLVFATQAENGSNLNANYILFAASLIPIISFIFLSFVKMTAYRFHIALDSSIAFGNILLLVLMVLFFGNNKIVDYGLKSRVQIAITVILLLLLLFQAFLIVNPSYKRWAEIEKYDATSDSYTRPKYSYLCILEWGSLLNYILMLSIIFLALYF